MKKSIIAAGAASVALAAMPIVGAFAANTYDNITTVISDGCTITDSVQIKEVNMTVAPGGVATSVAAPSISVTCNRASWAISAVGSSNVYEQTSPFTTTDLIAQNGTSGSYTYERIATGTATSGSNSNWAFKVASLSDDTKASIATGYSGFAAIPDTATPIVNGSAAATETVHVQYQVYAKIGQAAGQYKGQVTYTVSNQD